MWKEWSIIEARLSKVYPFALERRAIRAYVALSGHVRAVSVAHLSLLERRDPQGRVPSHYINVLVTL